MDDKIVTLPFPGSAGPDDLAEDAEEREREAATESILFVSGEPVHVDRICAALDLDRPEAERILRRLMDRYAYERRGIRIVRMEDRWQMCSSPDHGDAVRRAFEIRKTAKLSQPALEVLTIIAYYQPTTRAYVDQLRGVDSGYTVGLLLERGLIEVCGQLQAPGRPRLYRTTERFLRAFHLSSLEDLPDLSGEGVEEQLRLGGMDGMDRMDRMDGMGGVDADTGAGRPVHDPAQTAGRPGGPPETSPQDDPDPSPEEAPSPPDGPDEPPEDGASPPDDPDASPEDGASPPDDTDELPEDDASPPDDPDASSEDGASPRDDPDPSPEDDASPPEDPGASPGDSASPPDDPDPSPEEDLSPPDDTDPPIEDDASPPDDPDPSPEEALSPPDGPDASPEDDLSPQEDTDPSPEEELSPPDDADELPDDALALSGDGERDVKKNAPP